MKNFLLFFFLIIFINVYNLSAQETESYLKVIATSLADRYIKSNSDLIFTVQIAALKNRNKTLESIDNIIAIKEDDNLIKYRLGEFLTYKEATEFKKIVLSVCDDAFIVSIKNGKRIHIKEALKNKAIF